MGFVTLNPTEKDSSESLRYYIEEKGFVGAKLHPEVMRFRINDESTEPYYAMAEKLGIPVVFHTGVHGWRLSEYMPILIDEVAYRHPDLNILMAHVGGTAFYDQALGVIQNNSNVYAELANTRRLEKGFKWYLSEDRIKLLIDTVGPGRMIYGCDWPWVPADEIVKDIEWIRSWGLTKSQTELILGGNLRRILFKEKNVDT